VQKASVDQVEVAFAVRGNAFRDLLGRADQLRAGTVVVLHQVIERRVGRHAALVGGRVASLLYGGSEPFHSGAVAGLVAHLGQRPLLSAVCAGLTLW
jgi:hypothetical protein